MTNRFNVKATTFPLLVALSLIVDSCVSAQAADPPEFMRIVELNEGPPAAKDKVDFENIYACNEGMFPIYDKSIGIFKQHFRDRHNLIMGLFSSKGGRFILYRPGQPPLEAESPPPIYRIAKSVGHSAIAVFDLVAPYCTTSAVDSSWKGEMLAYRTRVQTARDSLNGVDIKSEDRELVRDAFNHVLAFMDKCLENGSFTYEDVEAYGRGIRPDLAKLITVASSAQVGHWYKVLEDWKKLLGKDWDTTYGLSNSIYLARQNNILFSVLVQFFGEKAINDRLLLLETTDFTTTPDTMMETFIRIISDRALGKVLFGDYHLTDYELMGGGGRHAIEAEAAKRGVKELLPPLVPFNSNAWPWRTDPSTGSGPALLEDVK